MRLLALSTPPATAVPVPRSPARRQQAAARGPTPVLRPLFDDARTGAPHAPGMGLAGAMPSWQHLWHGPAAASVCPAACNAGAPAVPRLPASPAPLRLDGHGPPASAQCPDTTRTLSPRPEHTPVRAPRKRVRACRIRWSPATGRQARRFPVSQMTPPYRLRAHRQRRRNRGHGRAGERSRSRPLLPP